MRGRNLVEVDDVGCLDPGLALGASLFPAPTAGLWPKPLRGFGEQSIPNVFFVPFDFMFFEKESEFVLKGFFLVMQFLIGDVFLNFT